MISTPFLEEKAIWTNKFITKVNMFVKLKAIKIWNCNIHYLNTIVKGYV